MSAQWTLPDFLDAFKLQLEAVAGLAGVSVLTTLPGPDTDTSDAIVLAADTVTGTTPWACLGQLRRDDTYTIPCLIQVVRPGAGETVAVECRDRVQTLFQYVLEEMKDLPAVGEQTIGADDIGYELTQGPLAETQGSRVAQLRFAFTVRSRVT